MIVIKYEEVTKKKNKRAIYKIDMEDMNQN